MPKLTESELQTFLEEPGHLARIATLDPDGMPRVLPLWFILDNNRICFTPRSPAIIWKNLLRDPRLAISIDEDPLPYRKVTVQGVVEVLHQPGNDDAWRSLYRSIAKRYTAPEAADAYVDGTDDQPRALCAISLSAPTTKVSTWRMPLPGENPTGIWHPRYFGEGTKMAKLVEGSRS